MRNVNKISKAFYWAAGGLLIASVIFVLFTGTPLTEEKSKMFLAVAIALTLIGATVGLVLNIRSRRSIKFEMGVYIGILFVFIFGRYL